jgi:Flp pilus assembly protein TadG
MRSSLTQLRQFLADEHGGPTVEFVVLFAPLLYLIFTIGELGVFMMRAVMIERGLDMAMRDVRLGTIETGEDETEVEAVRRRICEEAFLLFGCEDRLLIEVTPLADVSSFGTSEVNCVNSSDPSLSPADKFTPPGREQITFVRACLVSSPIFPGVGLGAQLPRLEGGGYGIIAETAFMNEP